MELIEAIVTGLGGFVLHALGKTAIVALTLGRYRVEPYDSKTADAAMPGHRQVSRGKTMMVGFVTLVILIILLAGLHAARFE